MIKKLINWSTMIINCWQPSSWNGALEVWFSIWKREVSGSTNGYLQLAITELIGPNISISSVMLHFLRNYLKNSPRNRLQKNTNWSTMSINCWQTSLSEGERSSVIFLALGARGHWFTPRLSPTRDTWINLSQQFHILRNIAFFFWKIKWKTVCTIDDKRLKNWSTMIINCWQPSSKDSDLELRFSLWSGVNQWLSRTRDKWICRSQQLHILSKIAFFEKLFEKQSAKQITIKNNLEN